MRIIYFLGVDGCINPTTIPLSLKCCLKTIMSCVALLITYKEFNACYFLSKNLAREGLLAV